MCVRLVFVTKKDLGVDMEAAIIGHLAALCLFLGVSWVAPLMVLLVSNSINNF